MMNVLDIITANKSTEIAKSKQLISLEQLKDNELYNRQCISFSKAIQNKSGVIAEFKRKSPSKGLINGAVSVEEVVIGYENAGASAVSVLTDTRFFGGTINDVLRARAAIQLPILRKDFIVDAYQLHEAKAMGADVILLIAAALDKNHCAELAEEAKKLGLNVFLELHAENELEQVNPFVDVVGINNRNLKTFEVDIQNSIRLAHALPKDLVKVAESGISDPSTVKQLKNEGFEGFLIGENFMKTNNPGEACSTFIQAINH